METAAGSLSVTVASSNTTLLPLSGLVLAGLGGSRTLVATPTIGRTGSATVTVTVSDGKLSSTDTFVVSVNPVGVGPVIAWRNGSVPEVMEEGRTGYVVDDLDSAVDAVRNVGRLSRERCREVFERRFTARRMAEDYLRVY